MNRRDLENIEFLLSASPSVLEDWYSKTNTDDHEYAMEILKTYQEELAVKLNFYTSEEITSTIEATDYLRKFQLK
jgi:hypothetical protein